jgi:hypothetical protein
MLLYPKLKRKKSTANSEILWDSMVSDDTFENMEVFEAITR